MLPRPGPRAFRIGKSQIDNELIGKEIMAINFVKTSYEMSPPVIWRGECKVLPGGFKIVNTVTLGQTVRRGTPLRVNFEDMTAAVVKAAKVLEGGSASKPRVRKGLNFSKGDPVCKPGTSDSIVTVSSVDTSNASYDVINLSGAISGLSPGDIIVEGESAEGTNRTKYMPNAIAASDLDIVDKIDTLDAGYEALVLRKNVPYAIPDEWLTGIALKENPNILFINQ